MKGKKLFIFFLAFFFLVQLFLVFYFNRTSISQRYDVSYWKDRFEHSQWVLPMSNRVIGDDGLFSYVGYTLAKGADPSGVNAETGPVGKYLLGFSILFFDSPIVYTVIIGFLTLTVYYFLLEKILKNRTISLFAVFILFADPLFFSQFFKSWVDSTQVFFLLLNILFLTCLVKGNKSKNFLYSAISGMSLGLFTVTKLPILFPILFVLESIFFYKRKFIFEHLVYLGAIAAGVLLPYYHYFALGHSFIDFLKLQKYIISFYRSSKLTDHIGAILQALITGNFPSLTGGTLTRVNEWTILWPVAALISLFVLFKIFREKKKDIFLLLISSYLILSVLILSFIPSYPRYLLLTLPFIYLFLAYFIQTFLSERYGRFIIALFAILAIVTSFLYLWPKPATAIADFNYNFSNNYFQDIYQEDISNNNTGITRSQFNIQAREVMNDAGVRNIQVRELGTNDPFFSKSATAKIKVTYMTQDLGSFSEDKTLDLVKSGSEWRIVWNWGLLLNGYQLGDKVKTTMELGRRGTITDKNGNILAQDVQGYLISVNPSKIDTKREQNMLKLISDITGIVPVRLQNAYLENPVPSEYVPLATTFHLLNNSVREKLLTYPGLKLEEYPSRIYYSDTLSSLSISNTRYHECCTRIYSAFNYHGVKGVEKEFDSKLSGYSGGTIKISDNKGNTIRVILDKIAKNGQNVKLL